MDQILSYIDLIWIPIAFFIVEKKHRWYTLGFVLSCLMVMRMQYEIIDAWGFGEEGFPDMLMSSHPYLRGIITYSIFIGLFIVLSLYSKKTDPIIYMAASISVFFIAFIVSFLIMSL